MLYLKTVNNSRRLILYRDEFPKDSVKCGAMLDSLAAFSIWGGFDGNEPSYLSWEFDINFPYNELKVALSRFGCQFNKDTEPCSK